MVPSPRRGEGAHRARPFLKCTALREGATFHPGGVTICGKTYPVGQQRARMRAARGHVGCGSGFPNPTP
ncbi:hypothetical protein PSEUDO8O_70225 [Pseudomonas sp. 8O]|nr:hypothetical protein PSEUDO8O_70225 [Pseudomonas sp. 8O]